MKVWYVCQTSVTREYGSSEHFILFSTQKKAEEKLMELVESSKNICGRPVAWELKNNTNKMLSACDSTNVVGEDCRYLDVGSYEIDSGEIMEG